MARPLYVWRLDELKDKATIRVSDTGAHLKIEEYAFRLWLHDGVVKIQELQDNGSWLLVEEYPAKTS